MNLIPVNCIKTVIYYLFKIIPLNRKQFIISTNLLTIDGCRGSRKSLINVQKLSFVKPFKKI